MGAGELRRKPPAVAAVADRGLAVIGCVRRPRGSPMRQMSETVRALLAYPMGLLAMGESGAWAQFEKQVLARTTIA